MESISIGVGIFFHRASGATITVKNPCSVGRAYEHRQVMGHLHEAEGGCGVGAESVATHEEAEESAQGRDFTPDCAGGLAFA